MINKLDNTYRFQQQALSLLTRRQDVLASNIANADTPGYLARDIDFQQQLKTAMTQPSFSEKGVSLSLTSDKHIASKANSLDEHQLLYRTPDQPSADGNTVDMDRERVNFADNTMMYQSGLTFLGGDIKKMMTVVSQG